MVLDETVLRPGQKRLTKMLKARGNPIRYIVASARYPNRGKLQANKSFDPCLITPDLHAISGAVSN